MYVDILHTYMHTPCHSTDGSIRGVESGLCVDVGSKASCQEEPWSSYPYCNPNLDPDTRAKDLVGRMTVVEKVRKGKQYFSVTSLLPPLHLVYDLLSPSLPGDPDGQ